MLFVVSAASKFHANPIVECLVRTRPRLAPKASALVQELRRLEAKHIKKQLHVNDALSKEYEKAMKNFEANHPVPACCLYDAPLFNRFDGTTMQAEDADWGNDHTRVFSGLYGLLRPFDEIQPLSLPVTLGTKLENSKGKFLRDYWRDHITRDLQDVLKGLPMPVIVTLANEDDTSFLRSLEGLPEGTHIAEVDFKMKTKAEEGEAMGELLRWAHENRCYTVEDLMDFKGILAEDEEARYRLRTKDTKGKDIVFEENVGDGGGVAGKLKHFGQSKQKFIKEVATGDTRYLRKEIGKIDAARDKMKKQARKNMSKVY